MVALAQVGWRLCRSASADRRLRFDQRRKRRAVLTRGRSPRDIRGDGLERLGLLVEIYAN